MAIALGLGGEAGARLARELGLLASPDTLLRRVRNAPLPDSDGVRVLGVDDFAFKRGNAYGTILVDLERRQVLDLLRDRSAESLTAWLRDNPGVEVVSRDRFPAYADAISARAPQATQVADRWHLVRNLAEALDEFLVHKRPVLKAAAEVNGQHTADEEVEVGSLGPTAPDRAKPTMAAPSTRHVAALCLRRPEKLPSEQRGYLDRLQALDGAVAAAYRLAQQFAGMVRDLQGEQLEEWLGKARSCEVPALRRFAASLGKDLAAVRAGLTERWSNGPVEGFVHKLKLVKRQGYGRANFDLLRARILAA